MTDTLKKRELLHGKRTIDTSELSQDLFHSVIQIRLLEGGKTVFLYKRITCLPEDWFWSEEKTSPFTYLIKWLLKIAGTSEQQQK